MIKCSLKSIIHVSHLLLKSFNGFELSLEQMALKALRELVGT